MAPPRRRIRELLATRPATITKHVRVLEDADLVIPEKVGLARECRLGPAELQDAARGSRSIAEALRTQLAEAIELACAYCSSRESPNLPAARLTDLSSPDDPRTRGEEA